MKKVSQPNKKSEFDFVEDEWEKIDDEDLIKIKKQLLQTQNADDIILDLLYDNQMLRNENAKLDDNLKKFMQLYKELKEDFNTLKKTTNQTETKIKQLNTKRAQLEQIITEKTQGLKRTINTFINLGDKSKSQVEKEYVELETKYNEIQRKMKTINFVEKHSTSGSEINLHQRTVRSSNSMFSSSSPIITPTKSYDRSSKNYFDKLEKLARGEGESDNSDNNNSNDELSRSTDESLKK